MNLFFLKKNEIINKEKRYQNPKLSINNIRKLITLYFLFFFFKCFNAYFIYFLFLFLFYICIFKEST